VRPGESGAGQENIIGRLTGQLRLKTLDQPKNTVNPDANASFLIVVSSRKANATK